MDDPIFRAFLIALAIPCAGVGFYFWGLKKAKAGEVVIFANEADAILGGGAAVALTLTLILTFLVGRGYPRFFLTLAALDAYLLFWVIYRAAIYNPTQGRCVLAVALRLNAIFLQMIALVMLILFAIKALSHEQRAREDGEIAAAAETILLGFFAFQFAVLFHAIATKTILERATPYEGIAVPNHVQLAAVALWAIVGVGLGLPFYSAVGPASENVLRVEQASPPSTPASPVRPRPTNYQPAKPVDSTDASPANRQRTSSTLSNASRSIPTYKEECTYPRSALRNGISGGDFMTLLDVDEDGNVTNVEIKQGSRSGGFEQELKRCMGSWKFQAGGSKYQVAAPFEFKLAE